MNMRGRPLITIPTPADQLQGDTIVLLMPLYRCTVCSHHTIAHSEKANGCRELLGDPSAMEIRCPCPVANFNMQSTMVNN